MIVEYGIGISIKPHWAELILKGMKTVELRKRTSEKVQSGTRCYIYATKPVGAITGWVDVGEIHRISRKEIWKRFGHRTCVSETDFWKYYSNDTDAHAAALELIRPRTLVTPIGLKELRSRFNFTAPQSYVRADMDFVEFIESRPNYGLEARRLL